jgi:hypothetical protein
LVDRLQEVREGGLNRFSLFGHHVGVNIRANIVIKGEEGDLREV